MNTVEIQGEVFDIAFDDEDKMYWITHPQWSLVGRGVSIITAMHDLQDEAASLANILDNNRKSDEAIKMKDFCIQIKKSKKPETWLDDDCL